MSDEDRSVVVEYVMENADNVSTAATLARIFPQIRQQIVKNFLVALSDDLHSRLGTEWLINHDCASLDVKYGVWFWMWKNSWPKDLAKIGFEAQSSGARDMQFGVNNPGKDVPGLKMSLDASLRPGRETRDWDWCQSFDDRYRSWDEPEAILALYRKTEAVSHISDLLTRVAVISAPLVERAGQRDTA